MSELEMGPLSPSRNFRAARAHLRANRLRYRSAAIAAMVMLLAVTLRSGAFEVHRTLESPSVVSLEEATYEPFRLDFDAPVQAARRFVPKSSSFNRKAQALNLVRAQTETREFLERSGTLCVHLRELGVAYDIVVFRNLTMVNPEVVSEADTTRHVREQALDGSVSVRRRPTSVGVKYLGTGLDDKFRVLFEDQAACLYHYLDV